MISSSGLVLGLRSTSNRCLTASGSRDTEGGGRYTYASASISTADSVLEGLVG